MGAGKSTVGELLAQRMRWSFLDLDPYIEASAGMAAKDIFAAQGESAFRTLESDALAFSLSQSNTIVALGGAAIDKPSNQLLLGGSLETLIVFLDAPFTTLIERCLVQERNGPSPFRPLLHNTETASARFPVRRALFAACASLIIDVAERTPEEVELLIWTELGKPKG